jgi:hypothetical protein
MAEEARPRRELPGRGAARMVKMSAAAEGKREKVKVKS